MSRIAVVGAGISGLTAAYYLSQANHKVTVFDGGERAGGAVQTIRDGSELMEAGPDSLLTSKPAAIELARELGVELVESFAVGAPGIVKKGEIFPLPDGFRLIAPTRFLPFALTRLLSLAGKIRAAAELFVPPSDNTEDESVAEFVSRRFGKEVLDTMAQPLIGGIYSADPSELSLQATFGFLQALEKSKGSVIRGMLASAGKQSSGSLFWAPKEGMGTIIDALQSKIGSENIRLSNPVSNIGRRGRYWVLAENNQESGFDGVVLACPAHRAAKLLGNLDPELVSGLEEVPYSSTATVHLTYEESQIAKKLQGSGFVVPHKENLDITACTYSHLKYPGRAAQGKALFRVHLGGQLNPHTLREEDPSLIRTATETLGSLLQIDGRPLSTKLVRHSKVVPQYAVGHPKLRERLDKLASHHSGLALGGNGIHGVGLADCVKQASACAQQIHHQLL